jgi:tRNA pseudouridine55 synthase
MISGIIVLNKPIDKSSSFISRLVGRRIGAKKVGHCGTLDPFATGVLLIAINDATKLIHYINPSSKSYEFEIVFGEKRNTADRTGRVVSVSNLIPSKEDVVGVLESFRGPSVQVPNQFSAIKVNGRRAYEMARNGLDVCIKQREITIFSLELISQTSEKSYILRASVSPGTYIRTLAEDIASGFSTFAYVNMLCRLADGKFLIENSISIDELEKILYDVESVMCKLEDILDDIPVVFVDLCCADALAKGQSFQIPLCDDGIVAVSSTNGFFAIVEVATGVAFPKRIIRFAY